MVSLHILECFLHLPIGNRSCFKIFQHSLNKKYEAGKFKSSKLFLHHRLLVISSVNKNRMTAPELLEKVIKVIVQNWIRDLNVKLGWINDFDEIIVKYVILFVFLNRNWKYLLILIKYFQLLNVLQGHTSTVTRVRFSFDGRKIVSSSGDNTIRIWDVKSKKQIQNFTGYHYSINVAEFSPDGNTIVSCSYDNKIRLWDVQSGKELKKLEGHLDSIFDVNLFLQMENILYQAHTIRQYEYGTILSSSVDKTIGLWKVKSGKRLKKLVGHSNFVMAAKFSPNGQFVVSCSWDKTVRIWDTISGKELKIFKGHLDMVRDVKYFPDGQTIVSCADDKTIRLWDVNSGDEIQRLKEHSDWVGCMDISPDGKIIISGSRDRTIRIWR
ncbi:WD-40 repeat protein [Reticulomyxa filosa]|uniref:WD-40 repeat protein n=1 Tax=Reticulomyxa filosa TaxID=46433 RepID=X6M3F9_RETFI|nr:WD-40 repeat protein [Reticulomyxa filosa]|eukprot:ETO08508.1 WD-40 repeat protein [Reticulomyxa filosa]